MFYIIEIISYNPMQAIPVFLAYALKYLFNMIKQKVFYTPLFAVQYTDNYLLYVTSVCGV